MEAAQIGSEGAQLATYSLPGWLDDEQLPVASSWQQGLQYLDPCPVRKVRMHGTPRP